MKGILFFLFFIFPLSSMAQERKAYTAYEEENYFQASEYYKLKVNKKNSPENHYNLGVSLYQEGLYTEANDHFLEALNSRKKETRQQALYNLGNSAYRNNQLTQAIDYYEKALSLNPSDQWAIDNLEYVKNKLQGKYKLAILSNQIKSWLEPILEEKKFGEIFDTIVTSYEVGSAKPDIKIYKEVLGKLNVKAEECVYIEDRIKNLEPAKILGMKTIEFKNYNQCVKDLEEILAD